MSVRLIPTPTVGDSKNARNSTPVRRKVPPTGIHAGNTLTDWVDLSDVETVSPQLPLFAAAFPVNRIALLVDAADLPTSAISGPRSSDSFASLDPDGSWRKTSQGYSQVTLDGSLERFSQTWPRAGMTRNGIAFQRVPSAPLTDGTGCGSWPTPTSNDYKNAGYMQANGHKYPTLPGAVGGTNHWPTPTSRDHKDGTAQSCANVPANGLLGRVVHQWPTPTGRDWKDGRREYSRKHNGEPTQDTLGRVLAASGETFGGSLNPTWVEWLMGYPLGWTVLKAWGTASSRKSPSGSPNGSKRGKRGKRPAR